MHLQIVAIRTDFKHHGEHYGYKQILKGIDTLAILGVNERDDLQSLSPLYQRYQWLFEFKARKFEKQMDVLHILYGEDYFRFSTHLFKKPVVVTFHQPAEILKKEITHGNVRGNLGRLTHLISKNRFKRLAAAIVTSNSQKKVLETVMPSERVHVIPLGIDLQRTNATVQRHTKKVNERPIVVTLGEWMRDWDFYFDFVEENELYDFHLINRKLPEAAIQRASTISHLHYHANQSDDDLSELMVQADIQFLPVMGMAGSNALLKGFALGCPLVITDLADQSDYTDALPFVKTYEQFNTESCKAAFDALLEGGEDQLSSLRAQALTFAQDFSWENVTKRTLEVYSSVVV